MSVRVSIKPGCTGMGSCTRLAPAVFGIDPATGKARVLIDNLDPHRAAVLESARACPFIAVEIDGVPLEEPVRDAVVMSAHRLIPDILELRLRQAGFAFIPGQYVFLRLNDAGGEFFRSFSVVDASDGVVTLCIRLVPNGRAGGVLTQIEPGATVGLSRAKGLFALATTDRPKLFVTGGTGLAPVIPMCRAAPQARKRVVVGARRPGDLFWLDRLRAIPNTEVVTVVQNADPGWTGLVGLVTAPLAGLTPAEWPEVYTCGGPGMVEAVRRELMAAGFPADALHSDSFLAAGSAAPRPAAGAAPPARTDWPGILRRAHGMASLPLALVMLFYALTGFIANRSELFVNEGASGSAERSVPADIPLTRDSLAPYLAGLLPAAATCDGWEESGKAATATFRNPAGGCWRAKVSTADRSVRIETLGTLPADLPLTPAAIASHLSASLSGEPDLAHAEDDDASLSLAFASVWGTHQVEVDKAERTWRSVSTRPPLVVSLTDLHRGKHAAAWQRPIIDLTALVLAMICISGGAMGLLAAAPARRRMALIMIGLSVGILFLLLVAR